MASQPLYQNTFILRRSTVANFVDIIKISTIINKTFKDSKKVKSVTIVGYVRHILGMGAFLVPPIHEQPRKKRPITNRVKIA